MPRGMHFCRAVYLSFGSIYNHILNSDKRAFVSKKYVISVSKIKTINGLQKRNALLKKIILLYHYSTTWH